jgi:integrase
LENTGSTSLVWLAAFRDETSLPAKPDSAGEAEAGMTFSRYAQQYLERWHRTQPIVEADRYRLAVLMAHFGAKRLGDISPIDIERFKLERRKSPTRTGQLRSLSSINRELRLLRRVLSSALREGLIPMDPMKGKVELYREGHRGERLLTREEEARLLAACTGRHEYLRPILVCALYTGLHRDELFNLKWSDINFRENLIYIRQSKVGKPRAIHMNGNVRAEIESLGSLAAEHEFVFAGLHAEPAPTSFRRDFQAACRVAGVEGLRFQDLRHTFAVRLARSSGNILDVARVLGLTRISAAMRYAHALPDRLAEAMDRLSRPTAEIVLMPTKTRVAV